MAYGLSNNHLNELVMWLRLVKTAERNQNDPFGSYFPHLFDEVITVMYYGDEFVVGIDPISLRVYFQKARDDGNITEPEIKSFNKTKVFLQHVVYKYEGTITYTWHDGEAFIARLEVRTRKDEMMLQVNPQEVESIRSRMNELSDMYPAGEQPTGTWIINTYGNFNAQWRDFVSVLNDAFGTTGLES